MRLAYLLLQDHRRTKFPTFASHSSVLYCQGLNNSIFNEAKQSGIRLSWRDRQIFDCMTFAIQLAGKRTARSTNRHPSCAGKINIIQQGKTFALVIKPLVVDLCRQLGQLIFRTYLIWIACRTVAIPDLSPHSVERDGFSSVTEILWVQKRPQTH